MRNDAVALQLSLPPLEHAQHVVAGAHGAKPEVIGAGAPDIEFARVQGVGYRCQQVRCQNQFSTAFERSEDLLQRTIKDDIRVDVEDVAVTAADEVCQRPGFDRGIEFEDVVLKKEVVTLWQVKLVERYGVELGV